MTDEQPTRGPDDARHSAKLDSELESLIRASAPEDDGARPSFESALRTRFIDDVRRQALSAATEGEGTVADRDDAGTEGWLPSLRRVLGLGETTSSSRWRPLVVPAALLALVAVFGWVVLPGGPSSRLKPPAITAAELSASNAAAWAAVESLAGAFQSASGDRYEEWVVWSERGVDRYRRLRVLQAGTDGTGRTGGTRGADGPAGTGEWIVSDGREEWVVDGHSGAIVASRPAPPPDQGAADLSCVSLALPSDLIGAVTAERLDGRPMYRVTPLGTDAEASVAAYWVDADDRLVYRIDGHDGQVLWQRLSLELNPDIPDKLFTPGNLDRLGA